MSVRTLRYTAGALLMVALAVVPLFGPGSRFVNFLAVALIVALVAQAWNLLAGYCGQFSFGHAIFFGTGAYTMAILQVHYGVNGWHAFASAIGMGAALGVLIGVACFRLGVRGSYFALITFAFAEVARIAAGTMPITGAAFGLAVDADPGALNFQFASREAFYYVVLTLVVMSLLLNAWIDNSRFGARMVAVRENEYAAAALGVDTFATKLLAIAMSGAIAAAAGAFHTQYFLHADAGGAFGMWISLQALLAPIVGGLGTVLGPLMGALLLHGLGEAARHATGDLPGIDLLAYAALLVVVVRFAPGGLAKLFDRHGLGRST